MMRIRTREVTLTRAVRFLHPRIPLYIVPRANNEFMIGATMIESAEKGAVSVRSAIELLSAAYALHPAFGEAEILEMSADVRPAFPDNEPRIEERERPHFRQRPLSPRLPARAGFRGAGGGAGVRAVEGAWHEARRQRRTAGRSAPPRSRKPCNRSTSARPRSRPRSTASSCRRERAQRDARLKDGDRIEIVAPRQGG